MYLKFSCIAKIDESDPVGKIYLPTERKIALRNLIQVL